MSVKEVNIGASQICLINADENYSDTSNVSFSQAKIQLWSPNFKCAKFTSSGVLQDQIYLLQFAIPSYPNFKLRTGTGNTLTLRYNLCNANSIVWSTSYTGSITSANGTNFPGVKKALSVQSTDQFTGYTVDQYHDTEYLLDQNGGISVNEGSNLILVIENTNLGNTTEYANILCVYKARATLANNYLHLYYDSVGAIAPTINYPKASNIYTANDVTFSWTFHDVDSQGQMAYEVQYRYRRDQDWITTGKVTSSATTYTVPGSTTSGWHEGTYYWRVRTYDSNDTVSTWSQEYFFVYSSTPKYSYFEGVTNDAIPTVSWYSGKEQEHAAWIRITDIPGNVLYDSKCIMAGNTDSYTCNHIFSDGNYICLFTLYGENDSVLLNTSYAFTISTVKPSAPVLSVVNNMIYNSLQWSGRADEFFIYRNDDLILITDQNTFDDYTVQPGIKYEYMVRSYINGYADSNIVYVENKYSGYYLHDLTNPEIQMQAFYSEAEYLEHTRDISNQDTKLNQFNQLYPSKIPQIYVEGKLILIFSAYDYEILKKINVI